MIKHTFCTSVALFILTTAMSADFAAAHGDPFRFHENKPERADHAYQGEGAALEMILIAGNTKIAMFGGEIYRVGDVIGGYTITAITIDTVTAGARDGSSRIFNIPGRGR